MPHLLPHIGTREGAREQGSIVMLLATDACEQAILHPLWRADPVTGRDGHRREALVDVIPDDVIAALSRNPDGA